MISCKRATELISQSMEQPLSWQEQLALKIHLFICETCEQFRKHSGIIQAALRGNDFVGSDDETRPSLSEEARQKIITLLKSRDPSEL